MRKQTSGGIAEDRDEVGGGGYSRIHRRGRDEDWAVGRIALRAAWGRRCMGYCRPLAHLCIVRSGTQGNRAAYGLQQLLADPARRVSASLGKKRPCREEAEREGGARACKLMLNNSTSQLASASIMNRGANAGGCVVPPAAIRRMGLLT